MLRLSTNKKKIINAGAWVFGAFVISQLIRLSSNLVVTRLLEPEMFGVMTLVYAVLMGIAMFTDAGLWAFLVRHKNGDEKKIYNVVWTVQVIRGVVIFLIITITSLFFLFFFTDEFKEKIGIYGSRDFLLVMMLIGSTALISGFVNMGHAIESRILKRGKIELIELASQLLGALVMIVWAYYHPTIWALASSAIIASLSKMILSNIYFEYKHSFSFDRKIVKEIYSFGKWIFLSSILTYIAMQFDKIFFGAVLDAKLLGVYGIAVLLIGAILSLISGLISKVLFPMYSKMQNDLVKLNIIYYKSRYLLDFCILVLALVLYITSETVVSLLYDERYHEAGTMMKYLALTLPGIAITSVSQDLLSAIGKTKIRMQVMMIRALAMMIMLPILFSRFGLYGAIFALVINPYLGFPLIVYNGIQEKIMCFSKEIFLFLIPLFLFILIMMKGYLI